jgi:hypothetical protein
MLLRPRSRGVLRLTLGRSETARNSPGHAPRIGTPPRPTYALDIMATVRRSSRKRTRSDRRKAMRFSAECDVQYWSPTGWKRTALVNLARGGVLLKTLHGLKVDTKVQLLLQRAGDGQRLAAHGTIRATDLAGTHIEFDSDLPEVEAWIGKVIQLQVLPDLERRLTDSPADPALMGELAAWYRELGEDAPQFPPAAAQALAAMTPEALADLRHNVEDRLQLLFAEIDGLIAVQRRIAQLQEKSNRNF